ncbi:rRNA small subunit methyltransferase B [Microcella daejeonensis]|uniref:rRNA small subunit methyltransferase B n=1 Tax=Microcella daejeonensis TaxID=2994971 RepID=A0A9E8MKE6_9MICO|nr:transcription antitermination factor NusB [Microcella daejeonensis]WAB81208.1 rRNA small subunit methyltransferase B [Microcella daejeonensis]
MSPAPRRPGRAGGDHRDDRRDRRDRADGTASRDARRPAVREQATPRRIAFDVVHAVSAEDAYANLVLPQRLRRASLHGADAAFATELAYGTLRRRGFYDAVIREASGRDLDAIDPAALDLLCLGAHQLLGMSTPVHAAVDETVGLTRPLGLARATGFVNAVMRRISERTAPEWAARLLRGVDDPDERLAIATAHPVWVVVALRAALEREGRGGELEALLESDNVPARVTLAALPGLAQPGDLGEEVDPTPYSPLGRRAASGDPGDDPAVAAGRVRVQDEGSQLAALALSRARPVAAGERWLDLCAGPGGKAALLAAEARAGGARFTANEVVPARAGLVQRALAAVDPAVEVRTADGRDIGRTDRHGFDRILLDAPCTGLGALRRRPEARWRKRPDDVPELAALQAELLDAALDALAPGGLLAYVTCSPHPDETTGVVDRVLDARPEVVRVDTAAVLAGVTRAPLDLGSLDGAVQLWPHRHGTDAMFIQLLTVPAAPPSAPAADSLGA